MILVGLLIGMVFWTVAIISNIAYVCLLAQFVKDTKERLFFRFAIFLCTLNVLSFIFVGIYVNRSGVLS